MNAQQRATMPKGTRKQVRGPSSAVRIPEDTVRARAYAIYLARGQHPGDALADWYQAQQELSDTEEGCRVAHRADLCEG